jgi:hypothetical protein
MSWIFLPGRLPSTDTVVWGWAQHLTGKKEVEQVYYDGSEWRINATDVRIRVICWQPITPPYPPREKSSGRGRWGFTDYPVGATWEAKNEQGSLRIWLSERLQNIEVWRWQYYHSDGTPGRAGWQDGDWETSYRKCQETCAYRLVQNSKVPRFKRIK